MHAGQRPAFPDAHNGHSHATNIKFFPNIADKSSPEQGIAIPRSRSQDRTPITPSTATEVKEAEDDSGETVEQSEVMKRLREIEQRQAKIEDLLGQIANSLVKH